jgi:hypothetical protein
MRVFSCSGILEKMALTAFAPFTTLGGEVMFNFLYGG